MRFKSAKTGPYQVLAVSGTNTISFAIAADKAGTKGLLGFAVERRDPEGKQDFSLGFKVFPSVIPKPDEKTRVRPATIRSRASSGTTSPPSPTASTSISSIRSRARRRSSTARAAPMAIRVQTEPLFSTLEHDVFFNRGVASSQAYTREFGNKQPDELTPAPKQRRGPGMAEPPPRRRHPEVHRRCAEGRHAAVLLLRVPLPAGGGGAEGGDRPRRRRAADHRRQGKRAQGQKGKTHGASRAPRISRLIKEAGMPAGQRHPARGQHQQHPAQQVHGAAQGQARRQAGRSVDRLDQHLRRRHPRPDQCRPLGARRARRAKKFQAYWELLKADPGAARDGDDKATVAKRTRSFATAVEKILTPPDAVAEGPEGHHAGVQPAQRPAVLDMYAHMVDEAEDSCPASRSPSASTRPSRTC